MASRSESHVFFPWEKRRGLLGLIGRARTRLVVGGLAVLTVLVLIHRREEHAAAVRATRASITTAGRAVAAYRADHGGKCPPAMADVVRSGYAHDPPLDAWGNNLRLECPDRRDPTTFRLMSDGPDGIYGGLDRVE